jgi:hypothetical protein
MISSGSGIGTSLPALTDGTHTITVKATDDIGHTTLTSITVTVDTLDPTISSVVATNANTVEVVFNEDLQNFVDGHHPDISDFNVYNDINNSSSYDEGDSSYGITSVSYADKKVTITLTNPINSSEKSRLLVNSIAESLIDLTNNYFNDGNSYDTNISFVPSPRQGHSSGGSIIPLVITPVLTPETGQVLGAEKFIFTLLLKMGSRGNEVIELQKFLNAAGYDCGIVDGIFGKLTKAAVIKFQLANGLVGDGIVGPLTRAVLNK